MTKPETKSKRGRGGGGHRRHIWSCVSMCAPHAYVWQQSSVNKTSEKKRSRYQASKTGGSSGRFDPGISRCQTLASSYPIAFVVWYYNKSEIVCAALVSCMASDVQISQKESFSSVCRFPGRTGDRRRRLPTVWHGMIQKKIEVLALTHRGQRTFTPGVKLD